MKNKNKFKIFHPFIKILFLLIGIFYSVNSFAYISYLPASSVSIALSTCQGHTASYGIPSLVCSAVPPVDPYTNCYNNDFDQYYFCATEIIELSSPDCVFPQVLDPETDACIDPPEFLCSDGSMSVSGSCPQQIICLDGSQHSAPFDCSSLTKICDSGLVVSKNESCDQPTKQCLDGSFVPATSFCPTSLDTICLDGTTVSNGGTCPTPPADSVVPPEVASDPNAIDSLQDFTPSDSSTVNEFGGSNDSLRPSKLVLDPTIVIGTTFGPSGSVTQPLGTDPCANGACETIDQNLPQDYAREKTLQRNVKINFEMGKLLEDIRFKELSSMVRFLNDSSNSLDVIQQYQKINADHFIALQKELGLQHLDDNAFHDLMIKGGDISRKYLYDIYKQITWADNEKLKNQNLSNNLSKSILDSSNKLLASSKQLNKDINNNSDDLLQLTQDITDNSDDLLLVSQDISDTSDDLLLVAQDTNSILSDALRNDGTSLNVGSVSADLGTATGDFSGLSSMGTDVQTITNDLNTKLSDTSELGELNTILNTIVPGISSLYTSLPSLSCSTGINENLTLGGKSISFNLDVCSRLSDLKLALAWIFGFYAMRTAFNNIFAPKGI